MPAAQDCRVQRWQNLEYLLQVMFPKPGKELYNSVNITSVKPIFLHNNDFKAIHNELLREISKQGTTFNNVTSF